jgi:hypothetical protein
MRGGKHFFRLEILRFVLNFTSFKQYTRAIQFFSIVTVFLSTIQPLCIKTSLSSLPFSLAPPSPMSLYLRNNFRNETPTMAGTLSPKEQPHAQRIHRLAPLASAAPRTHGAARVSMILTAVQPVRDAFDSVFLEEVNRLIHLVHHSRRLRNLSG